LVEVDGKLLRQEFHPEAWVGPPAGALAHWLGRIPTTTAPKKPPFQDGVLLDCLDHLATAHEPNRVNFRYVVALLLLRRRKLKLEESRKRADGQSCMVVRDLRTGQRIEILDPHLGEAEIEAVQDEVFQVLGWD
jgi:hypothetical protein